MAKRKKTFAIKFVKTDKRQIRGRVQHTRTGACTSRGRCYHGKTSRAK